MSNTEAIIAKIKEIEVLMKEGRKEGGESNEFFEKGGSLVLVASLPGKEKTENLAVLAGKPLSVIKTLGKVFEGSSEFKKIVKTALEAAPIIGLMDMFGDLFYAVEKSKEKESSKTENESAPTPEKEANPA